MKSIKEKSKDLLEWLPLFKKHSDYLSQRVINHATLSGLDIMLLSLTLEIEENELERRWCNGQGFTDISEASRYALAEFLDVPLWHLWFLTGELCILDLVTESRAKKLVSKAESFWPELLTFDDDATALFALFLNGEELIPTTSSSKI